MEVALYGGRIDSNHDMLVLRTYLKKYLNSNVLKGGTHLMNKISVPQGQGQTAKSHLELFS